MVAGAKMLQDLGCDFVIHHIGYDERRGIARPRPADAQPARTKLREVVAAVTVPVQAVGGLTIEQAVQDAGVRRPVGGCLGAPLTIDADAFKTATGGRRRLAPPHLREGPRVWEDVKVGP